MSKDDAIIRKMAEYLAHKYHRVSFRFLSPHTQDIYLERAKELLIMVRTAGY